MISKEIFVKTGPPTRAYDTPAIAGNQIWYSTLENIQNLFELTAQLTDDLLAVVDIVLCR